MKPCQLCGKLFVPYRSYQKFCCDAHRKIWHAAQPKQDQAQRKEYRKLCQHCGKQFVTDRDNRKFCCEKCCTEYNDARYIPVLRHTVVCSNCGKQVRTAHARKRFCCEACRIVGRKKERTK